MPAETAKDIRQETDVRRFLTEVSTGTGYSEPWSEAVRDLTGSLQEPDSADGLRRALATFGTTGLKAQLIFELFQRNPLLPASLRPGDYMELMKHDLYGGGKLNLPFHEDTR